MWLAHSNQQVRIVTERNFAVHHWIPSNLPPPFQQTSSAQLLTKRKDKKRHFALWSTKHVLPAQQTLPEAPLPHLCSHWGYASAQLNKELRVWLHGVGKIPWPHWNAWWRLPVKNVVTTPAQCPLCQWHSNQVWAQGHQLCSAQFWDALRG